LPTFKLQQSCCDAKERGSKIETLDKIASINEFTEAEVTHMDCQMGPSETELDNFHKDYGFQISPSLGQDQKYEALAKLYRYRHVFARDVTKIKACKGPPLKIRLHTTYI